MPDPILSIITVTLDNLAGLEVTLGSVSGALKRLPAGSLSVEVLVKDGGSGDGTLAYLERLALPGLRVATGADGGIYEAMNEALRLSNGRWILFLNAGDRFADTGALARLIEELGRGGGTNVVYADCMAGDRLLRQNLSIAFLTRHMINHQSICYARAILKDGYDTRYRLCADYAHLLDVYGDLRAVKLDTPICVYDDSGRSSDPRNYHKMWRERLQAVWRSPLPLAQRLRLSSRGVVMWPLQYLRARIT